MNDKDTLNRYFKDNIHNSLYISKNMKKRQLWKPVPYKKSGLVRIAENPYEL